MVLHAQTTLQPLTLFVVFRSLPFAQPFPYETDVFAVFLFVSAKGQWRPKVAVLTVAQGDSGFYMVPMDQLHVVNLAGIAAGDLEHPSRVHAREFFPHDSQNGSF